MLNRNQTNYLDDLKPVETCCKFHLQFRKILEDVNINIFPQNVRSGLWENPVVSLFLQRLREFADESLQSFIGRDLRFDLLNRVHHRRVMFAAEGTTNLRVAMFCQVLAEIHRHLTRM